MANEKKTKSIKQFIPRVDVTNRIQKHKREFNRYNKEVKETLIGRQTLQKIRQRKYGSESARKELAIIDELEYILNIYCFKEVKNG